LQVSSNCKLKKRRYSFN